MKAVWLLVLCLGVWAAVSFALPEGEGDEDLVNALKNAISDKVKIAAGEATEDEAEEAEEAADVQDDSDEEVADELEAEEDEEEASTSRKRSALIKRRRSAVCIRNILSVLLAFTEQKYIPVFLQIIIALK